MPHGVPQHTSDYLRNSSGNFAMFTEMRLASSFDSKLAADRRRVRHCENLSPADRAQHYKTDYERK